MGSEDLEEMKPPASFDLLSRILHFGNEDEENWWYSTAPMFAHMMADAGYDIHMQYRWLYFHKEYIIPALGPYPKKGHPMPWKSILTRHGPPFELSFNFTKSLVRSAFEPIGPLTGTDRDPFNSKMIWDVLEKLRPVVPGLDLQRFTHFIRELTTSEEEAHTILSQKSPISVRDWRVHAGIKVIRKVDHDGRLSPTLSTLENLVASRSTFATLFFSCDLIDPSQSRIKVYGLEHQLDWNALEELWTVGGLRTDSETMNGLELLRELWTLLPYSEGPCELIDGFHELGTSPKERLPLIVNFHLHPDDPIPEPQIYFPAFGQNDKEIADALKTFFERVGWTELAESYKSNLSVYYPDEPLDQTTHVQAWISYSSKNKKPYLSAYLHTFETFGGIDHVRGDRAPLQPAQSTNSE